MNNTKTKIFAVFAVAIMVLSAGLPLLLVDGDADSNASSFKISDDYITPVKDQKTEGLCWAFAISSVLETELIAHCNYPKDTLTSPLYVAIQEFDGYDKEYQGGDFNGIVESGKLNSFGGTQAIILQTLIGKNVPVEEYLAPYDEFFVNYSGAERDLPAMVQVKSTTCCCPQTDSARIKELLMDNHAGVFLYSCGSGNNLKIVDRLDGTGKTATCGLISDEGKYADHAVTLVGWDDNYPKENFDPQPKSNGAWLVKNSWGTTLKGQDVDGYNWISYEHMIDVVVFVTDVENNDGSMNTYSYDHGYSCESDIYRSGSATMANVFTSEREEYLTGTSMTFYGSKALKYPEMTGQEYRVKVYALEEGYTDPTDGKLLYTSDKGIIDYAGSYHVEFDYPIHIHKGERFSICVEFTGNSICMPVDTDSESYYYNCHTVAESGQSMFLYNGEWVDLSADGKSNFRLMAYTETIPDNYVAKLIKADGSTKMFTSLQQAVDSASAGDTVFLLESMTLQDTLVIDHKGFTLDLRGFALEAKGKNVISVKDSDVTIQFGKLISSGDSPGSSIVLDNSEADIMRVYLDSSANGIDAKNGSHSNLLLCTFDYSSTSSVPFRASGGSELMVVMGYRGSNPVSTTFCVIDSTSKLYLYGGYYTGNVDVSGTLLIYSGEFNSDLGSYVDGTKSYWDSATNTAGPKSIRYNDGTGDKYTYDLWYAMKHSTDGQIQLLTDIAVNTIMEHESEPSIPITVDLNGFNISCTTRWMFYCQKSLDYDITFTNSSSTTSKINCRGFGKLCNLTIGQNIEARTTSTLFDYLSDDYRLSVDKTSSIILTKDYSYRFITSVPFMSDDGKYCEATTEVTYDKHGKLYSTEVGVCKFLSTGSADVYEDDYTITYADGNIDTVIEKSDGSITTTTTTCSDGTVKINIDADDYTADLVKDGHATITYHLTIPATSKNITKNDLVDGVEEIGEVKKELEQYGCTSYDSYVRIKISANNHILTKDAVDFLAGEDIGIIFKMNDREICATSQFLSGIDGNLELNVENTSSKYTNVHQRSAIKGTELVYDIVVKVDGKPITGKFAGELKITFSIDSFDEDLKAYTLDSDGRIREIDSVMIPYDKDDTSCSIEFTVDSACSVILAKDCQTSADTNPLGYVIIVAALIVAAGFCITVALVKRH